MKMRESVIVVGAGGHAKVCIELLHSMGKHVAYCVAASDSPTRCLGIAVLQGDNQLKDLAAKGYNKVFVAIGNNSVRLKMAELASHLGFSHLCAVSSHATVSPSARIGKGVAIMAGAIINADTEIGDFTIINTGAIVEHDCRLGVGLHIAPQSALAGNVKVGDCTILGVGTTVIPGIKIGARAVVGAGSVVVRDIPDDASAKGVPAKLTT